MSIRSFVLKASALLPLAMAPFASSAGQPLSGEIIAHYGSVATPRTVTVSTSIVLTISTASTISYGESVNGYALVSSSDGASLTGTVTFFDGTENICSIPVTLTTSCPPSAGAEFAAGTHMLTAVYSGDAAHLRSTSNSVPVEVLPDTTTLNIASSANPANNGQNVVFTATARGHYTVPLGQIELFDGTNLIATVTLSSAGVATLATSTLALGTHSITARYAATQNFGAATSGVLNQVIQSLVPVATTTTLAANINPAASGQNIIFTANVVMAGQSPTPTGAVTFLDGNTALETATLNSFGIASFNTAALGVGSHAISAQYAGNTATAASSSASLAEVINASLATGTNPFALTVVGSPTVVTGRAVNLLVTVAPQIRFSQPVQLSCANLPSESACAFGAATLPANGGTTTLQISTMAPRACESDIPYTQNAAMPFAAPALAGLMLLFIPRRRKLLKNLLIALIAVSSMASLIGCGNCTDLGTKPGDYTIRVVGTLSGTATTTVVTKVVLHVTVPLS